MTLEVIVSAIAGASATWTAVRYHITELKRRVADLERRERRREQRRLAALEAREQRRLEQLARPQLTEGENP